MKNLEFATRHHTMLRYGLDILEGMIRKMENGERIEISDAATVLKYLRSLGEEGLPSHGEGTSPFGKVEESLRRKRARDFVRDSRELGALLRIYLETGTSPSEGDLTAAQIDAGLSRLGSKYVPAGTRTATSFH